MFKASSAWGVRVAMLAGVLAGAPFAAQAQVYKCPQPNGTVGFQGTPCPGGSKQAVSPATPDTAGHATSSTSSLVADVQARNRRENEQQAYAEAHKHDTTPARVNACNVARHNLDILNQQRPVYKLDDKGNRVFVEDKDRDATIAQYQRQVSENCN